jgi:hypothetical protein
MKTKEPIATTLLKSCKKQKKDCSTEWFYTTGKCTNKKIVLIPSFAEMIITYCSSFILGISKLSYINQL